MPRNNEPDLRRYRRPNRRQFGRMVRHSYGDCQWHRSQEHGSRSNVAQESQAGTMLSRTCSVLSLSCVLDVTAVVRASDMQALTFDSSRRIHCGPIVTGAFILLVRPDRRQPLTNTWQGAAAIIVSLLGWLVVLRGLAPSGASFRQRTFVSVENQQACIGAQAWWVTHLHSAIGAGRAVPDLRWLGRLRRR